MLNEHRTEKFIESVPAFVQAEVDQLGRIYTTHGLFGQGGTAAKAEIICGHESVITEANVKHYVAAFNDYLDATHPITRSDALLDFQAEVRELLLAIEASDYGTAEVDAFKAFAADIGTDGYHIILALRYGQDMFRYMAAREAGSDEVITTRRVVPIDARAYVLQELAYLQGSRQLGAFAGLNGSEAVDPYLTIALSIAWYVANPKQVEAFGNDKLTLAATKVTTFGGLPNSAKRTIVKPAAVRMANGGKFQGVIDGVTDAAEGLLYVKKEGNKKEVYAEANAVGALAWYVTQGLLSGNFRTDATIEVNGQAVPVVALGQPEDTAGTCTLQAFVRQLAKSYPSTGKGFKGVSLRVAPDSFELFVSKPVKEVTKLAKKASMSAQEYAFANGMADKASTMQALVPGILHCLDSHMIQSLIVELASQGVDQLFPVHDCLLVPLDAVDAALAAYPKAHYAAVRKTGGDVLRFIADYRLEQLHAERPRVRDGKNAMAQWTKQVEAAEAAKAMTTGSAYLLGDDGQPLTIDDLEALVDASAFTVGG